MGKDILEFYRGKGVGRGRWRWRYKAAGNFKVVAQSSEAYANLDECAEYARRTLDLKPFKADRGTHFRVARDSGWHDVLVVVGQ